MRIFGTKCIHIRGTLNYFAVKISATVLLGLHFHAKKLYAEIFLTY